MIVFQLDYFFEYENWFANAQLSTQISLYIHVVIHHITDVVYCLLKKTFSKDG